MGAKKISKKLFLKKETVTRLNGGNMNRVKGGDSYTVCTCPTGCGVDTCEPPCDVSYGC